MEHHTLSVISRLPGGAVHGRNGWSVRARMTTAAALIMALVCLAVTVLVLLGLRDLTRSYRTERVANASLKVVHLASRGQLPATLPNDPVDAIQVLNSEGEVIAATERLAGERRIASFEPGEDTARVSQIRCDLDPFPEQCMIVAAFRMYEPGGDWVIYAAHPDVEWYIDPRLVVLIVLGAALLVGVTAVATYRTVSRTLAPVEAIRAELAEINATDLGRRVPVPATWDEIRGLAVTVNQTLDRLEALVEQQRRFASDASHDLRSPLTAMRTQVEEALLHPEDTDWTAMTRALLGSIERLEALVSDLLMLAKLDAGAPAFKEDIDLADLVTGELDRRPRKVKIVRMLQPGVAVRGDRLRLARLVTNLLDNAERHAHSHVAVTLYREDGTAVLEVLDDGAGIAPDQRELVFQRFTRLDAARSRDAGGTGLGLPIAREIAEAHGGSLTIKDSFRGARFVLCLPRD
jgi:signal transduction histidine kinase